MKALRHTHTHPRPRLHRSGLRERGSEPTPCNSRAPAHPSLCALFDPGWRYKLSLSPTRSWSLQVASLAPTLISSVPGMNQGTALPTFCTFVQAQLSVFILCSPPWSLNSQLGLRPNVLPCPASSLHWRIRPFPLLPGFGCKQHPADSEYALPTPPPPAPGLPVQCPFFSMFSLN